MSAGKTKLLKYLILLLGNTLILFGCTKLEFAPQPGSEVFRVKGGVKIEEPAAMTVDRVGIVVKGTCTKGFRVDLSGPGVGLVEQQNLDCTDGLFSAYIKYSDNDGVKKVIARQDLNVNNNGQWAADERDFLKDTIGPLVVINNPANNSEVNSGTTISGTCESGLNVDLYLSGQGAIGQVPCLGGVFALSYDLPGADGLRNIIAQQTDAAGNKGSDNKNIIKDTVAPAVAITSPAPNTLSRAGLTVSGTCESGLNVNLTGSGIASTQTTACTNGQFSTSIVFSHGDGIKNIVASQTDRAGNAATSSRDFQKDNTPPVIRITSPASGFVTSGRVQVSGICETGLPVIVSGTAFDGTTRNIDCNSGQFAFSFTITGSNGIRQLEVAQTDGAQNTASDHISLELDTIAPRVSITAPAPDVPATSGVTVSGQCENGLDVVITGSGVANSVRGTCVGGTFSIPIIFTADDGPKNVTVSQTDRAGNTGSDQRTFVRDSTAPVIAITSPAPNFAAQNGVQLQGTCESGLNVEVSGSGVLANTTTACTAGRFDTNISFSSGDGIKNIVVSQTDRGGNKASDQRNFLRDTVAPVVVISTPAENSYVRNQMTLTGTCEDGLTVLISGAGISASTTTSCVNGQFNQVVDLSLGDGSKVITVSQTDNAGNKGTHSRSFIKDTQGPAIAITSPAANTVAKAGVTLQGTCEAGIEVNISGSGLASPAVTNCREGTFSVDIVFTDGDGVKNIMASQTDQGGNSGSDSRNFIRDSTAPVVRISSPIAGATVNSSFTLEGSCELGIDVVISGSGVANSATVACTNGGFSHRINLNSGDGSKQITVTQTDLAGNVGSDQRVFVLDTTAPAVAITSPADGSVLSGNTSISGTCEAGLNVEIAGSGIQTPVTVPCQSGGFNSPIVFTAGDGSKVVSASQVDAVGNRSTVSATYSIDSQPPVVKIISPDPNTVAQTGIELRGSCESGIEVVIDGAGVDGIIRTPCLNSSFVKSINFSIGEGAKLVRVSQTDAAGNTGSDTRTFQKDIRAPSLAFTAPKEGSQVNVAGISVQGTCENSLTVHLMGSGLLARTTTPCNLGQFAANVTLSSGDGDKNIIAYQTDAAGNTGSAVLNLVLDTTAPLVQITGPNAGSVFRDGVTVVGTCESGIDVVASGSGVQTPVTQMCSNGQFRITVVFTDGDGAKTIEVSQTDKAGNSGSDRRVFNRVTAVPVVRITAPPAGTRSATGLTLQGTCENGLTVHLSGPGLASPSSTACANGQFSQAILFSDGDGLKTIIASQTNASGNTGSDQRDFIKGFAKGYDVFNVTLTNPRVDILFVDDNSSSMEADQLKLGQKFSSFISGLNGVDWQIGITTTDCSSGPFGICGSLLPLTGASGKILAPTTPNYEKVFLDTIYRPETIGCQQRQDCPSSNEQPLLASMTAMDKRNSVNSGFFRNDSDLAIIVLSDEDEKSNAPPTATTPTQAQNHFKQIWPSGKKLSVYGIIIQPNDKACLDAQVNQGGGFAFYGTFVDQWSKLTGGLTGSICDLDYSTNLHNIGRQVRTVLDSVELTQTPLPNTVRVVFTPNQNITWTVQGNRVLFSEPPAVGTRIEVFYDYQ